MPVEQPQFIDTLTPEWPLGTDPRSDGDNHIRLIKQVLKNTLPGANAAITGSPPQLNNLTTGVQLQPADAATSQVVRFKVTDPATADAPALAAMEVATPTPAQYVANPALTLTYQAVMDIVYPQGRYLFTSNPANPAEYLGFGTWEARAGYIAGVGDITDPDAVLATLAAGQRTGWWHPHTSHLFADAVAVTVDWGGSHQHNYSEAYAKNMDGASDNNDEYVIDFRTGTTSGSDGGHAHTGSVVIGTGADPYQLPGYNVYIWERTA